MKPVTCITIACNLVYKSQWTYEAIFFYLNTWDRFIRAAQSIWSPVPYEQSRPLTNHLIGSISPCYTYEVWSLNINYLITYDMEFLNTAKCTKATKNIKTTLSNSIQISNKSIIIKKKILLVSSETFLKQIHKYLIISNV